MTFSRMCVSRTADPIVQEPPEEPDRKIGINYLLLDGLAPAEPNVNKKMILAR